MREVRETVPDDPSDRGPLPSIAQTLRQIWEALKQLVREL
jgi:hypothetical protein